jgi:hypothetical protein
MNQLTLDHINFRLSLCGMQKRLPCLEQSDIPVTWERRPSTVARG